MPTYNGTDAADQISGDVFGPASDTINGLDGDDQLAGFDQADRLYGGAGADWLYGGNSVDLLFGGSGDDSLYDDDADTLNGDAGNDLISSYGVGATIDGGEGNDTILRGARGGSASGGVGDDLITVSRTVISGSLHGGDGIDTLSFDDAIFDSTSGGVDFSGFEIVTGTISGTAGNDFLDFSAFDSVQASSFVGLSAGGGADRVIGGNERDSFFGESGNDNLSGGDGGDGLHGGTGNDTLVGGDGDDVVDGGAGTNSLSSGDGNDIIFSEGVDDTVDSGAGDDVIWLYETALLGGPIRGGDGQDQIIFASTIFDGGSGKATFTGIESVLGGFFGTSGNDVLDLSTLSDPALATSWLQLFGGDGADRITGGSERDTISAGAGDDILSGGLGPDEIDGGAGTDTATYVSATGAITVDLAAGKVTGAAGADTLAGIENIIGSSYNDRLADDGNNNMLTGGGGDDDMLWYGFGTDIFDGGSGLDTADFSIFWGVTVSLLSTGYQAIGDGKLSLRNIENLTGSWGSDTLTGNQFGNLLEGSIGNDVLNGGLGNDILDGGDGIDTASYATATGAIRANLTITTAQSTISAGSDTLSGIENLMGGAYDDQLTGDAGNNVLTGNAGNDLLVGGLGDDMLSGGAGIDTASYANATAGVTISLLLTTAQNTGGAGLDSFVSIENLTGSTYDDVITGSAQVNVINGGNGNDMIDAGSSNDTVDGGYGNDMLKGAAGDDILIGGVGTDTLTGGAGADTLTGGTQNDRFVYAALTDSTLAAADRIVDFAKGDILDMSAIDASSKLAGNQAFVQAAAFTHVAGQFTLAFDAGTNTTTALFDTDGDAAANMVILFTGDVTTLTGGWLL